MSRNIICALFFILYSSFSGFAEIRLPRLISDGMVLQRDQPLKIWGWAAPNEPITLRFKNQNFNTTADNAGKWLLQLPPQPAGGPYDMLFTAGNNIQIKNILFGDVWLCSGQSNMETPMERVQDKYPDEIMNANYNEIRQFIIPDRYNFNKPEADVPAGEWQAATRAHIMSFSAVAYFFAKNIYEQYHIPIGLINSALGGSPAEAWISEEALKQFPAYYEEAQRFKNKELIRAIEQKDREASAAWYKMLHQNDEGLKNNWKNPDLNDADWSEMNIPGYWADQGAGQVNGVVWFRKEVNIPANFVNKPVKLLMGRIVDADSVFINGQFVGNITYQYPPRRYILKPDILKEGKNTIVIRVVNNGGKGGFIPDKPYELIADNQTIDLKGKWKYKIGAMMNPAPGSTAVRWEPLGLYNAMIAPLTNYKIKGVLWYQGESNTKNPGEYADLMRTLIADWRKQWAQEDLPFLYVQLPNFMEVKPNPSESSWAELRQAQLELLKVPNTGMAVTIELGEWNDIHPLNKKDVGERLALQAKKIVYDAKNIIASGPLYQSMRIKDNKIVLTFSNIGKGLMIKDGNELKYFAIAGADGKYVWAKAIIKGKKVIVWQENIKNPVAVRYAWADNPEGANLYNKTGLPASPFQAILNK